ncbi:MAG: sigma-70 family RNA polymerase sigma factor [Acidobacteriota bacterium]
MSPEGPVLSPPGSREPLAGTAATNSSACDRPAGTTLAPEGNPDLPAEVEAIFAHGAAAWRSFLQGYSPFILGCIRRFARDYDERMEIYVHVCCRLQADDCRRIRQYRGRGAKGDCKFSTWLAAVTFNLAREWIRTSRGRRRMFRVVRDLDRTDRLIFRYYFWDGYGIQEITSSLRTRHRLSISSTEVIERLGFVERRLSKDHRWRLVTALLRSVSPISLDHPRHLVREAAPFELPDLRSDPETRAGQSAAERTLRELIEGLPRQEQMALRLKFDRGLTARGVARALGIRNHKRVYEIQARALAKLAAGLRDRGIELADFGPARHALDILK